MRAPCAARATRESAVTNFTQRGGRRHTSSAVSGAAAAAAMFCSRTDKRAGRYLARILARERRPKSNQ